MIVVITGPTAVGKTKLSIALAQHFSGEVINADSTQVYEGLEIATAKVTEKEMNGVPHHLFGIKKWEESYTVFDYQSDARLKIQEIKKRNHVPFLVGGTGLYLKATLYHYEFVEEANHDDTRTTEELYQQLKKVDPDTEIHEHNRKRLIRAIRYFEETGLPFSKKEKTDRLYYPDIVWIGLTTDRLILYQRINDRVDQMMKEGLLEETEKIYKSEIRSKAILTPIGYKELFPYFEGTEGLPTCIERIKQHSRNYAKRQYTWNHHQFPLKWFSVNFDNFDETISDVIAYLEKMID